MTIDLALRGMTCLGCATHITEALRRVPGVASAQVDYRAGHGSVELADGADRSAALDEALVQAVARAGYGATIAPAPATAERQAPAPPAPAAPAASGSADFDLLVIGTGGAGVAAAIQAVGMGGTVAIAEQATLGGTCVNVGCIPSKVLIEAAAHVHAARRGFPGIAPAELAFDWGAVVRAKDELVASLRKEKYADVLASYPGLVRLAGHATLLSSEGGVTRVRVGDAEHRVRRVIIATGTTPALPPLPGLADVAALDSTSAMALTSLPASLLVLGGGPVGVELGQLFARFGVQVTIVQRGPQLLPGEDPEVVSLLRAALEAEGIEVHTGTEALRAERGDAGVVVHVRQGRLDGRLSAERVLVATGRVAVAAELGLDDVGVTRTARGHVQVDATMRTSNPGIFAAGDVVGGPAYVYVAAAGGRAAAENAMRSLAPTGAPSDQPRALDLAVVPSVTFTSPQVASVGRTEAAARAEGIAVDVSVLAMGQLPRALVAHDTRGIVKVVAESATGKILGVHAVSTNAGELMGEAALAVRFGLTHRDLAGTLHAYLTWGESMKLASQGFASDISKLSCCA